MYTNIVHTQSVMSGNANCYGNYLARIRAENYLKSLPDCTADTVLNCSPDLPPADPPSISSGCSGNRGRTVLGQSRIRNKKIAEGTTFTTNTENMICSLPFIAANPSCTCGICSQPKRLICISARLVVVDPTPDCVVHLFFSVCHDGGKKGENVYNLCHEYTTGMSPNYSGTIAFDVYLDVPVDIPATNATHHAKIYATSTSPTCYLSANQGAYSTACPAGLSFITAEDTGGIA
jgi:hypothetical protein